MLVPDWLRTTPVAHRGLHDANRQVPENSLAAFLLAIEHGFAIECDIRLSRDGVPMVFHDATLERLCQRKEALRDLTAERFEGLFRLRYDGDAYVVLTTQVQVP